LDLPVVRGRVALREFKACKVQKEILVQLEQPVL